MVEEPRVGVEEPFPYGTPLWRRSHRAVSPDGTATAEIVEAREVRMSEPTRGDLRTSDGLVLPFASPAFLFSDDGRYLAVPVWTLWALWWPAQRLGIVDRERRRVHRSRRVFWRVEPLAFTDGVVDALVWPKRTERVRYRVPEDLAEAFEPLTRW